MAADNVGTLATVSSGGTVTAVQAGGTLTLVNATSGTPSTVTRDATSSVVEIRTAASTLTAPAAQGAEGIPGIPGPPGKGSVVTLTALAPLGGHRVVKSVGDRAVAPASSDSLADIGTVLGITAAATPNAGGAVDVITGGEVIEPSWNWPAPCSLFLGIGGAIQAAPPSSGFTLKVGTATSPTSMSVAVGLAIVRE